METGFDAGHKVLSRTGDGEGLTTGSYHDCQLSGCSGQRISVLWPDGRHTFPCSRAMRYEYDDDSWQIV